MKDLIFEFQRESNMHRIEVHHFASPFGPQCPGGGKQWIHTGDPVEIVGLPTERGGTQVTQNGNHNLVHI